MKQTISIITLCLIFLFSKGQDLIVTEKGDSLNCKITKVNLENIYFIFKKNNEIKDTLLNNSKIKYFKKDYFSISEVPKDKIPNNYSKISINIDGGWSYMTAKVSDKVPSELHNYVEELKSGYHFGGDVDFFPFKYFGFGLKYSRFRTSNQLNNVSFVDSTTGQIYKGKLRDDITVQYFGPSFCARIPIVNNKVNFNSDFSFGYLSYKNNAIMYNNYMLKGKTLGLLWNFGIDYKFESSFSIGLTCAYTFGRLSQYEYSDARQTQTIKPEKEDYEGLSRIDISVGLKWNM